ncbi:MAG: hypothetical protein ACKOAG_07655 [Candidatus Kapaibacterium sp.]
MKTTKTMKTGRITMCTVAVVMLLAGLMTGCFKDPITGPVDGTPVDPKPVQVMQDSVRIDLLASDDFSPGYESLVFSNRAPYLEIDERSTFVVDTTGRVPVLRMNAWFSPVVRSLSDAREVSMRSVQVTLDSLPVVGDDWRWLQKGEVAFTVRTSERPTIRYTRIPIVSPKPPTVKDEPYARVIAWKVTDRKEIVMKIEAQCVATITGQGGSGRDRFLLIGTIRVPY